MLSFVEPVRQVAFHLTTSVDVRVTMVDTDGISYERVIEELTEMENMDGQILQNMWRIAIVASYEHHGEPHERVAETFRYEPLYQANR